MPSNFKDIKILRTKLHRPQITNDIISRADLLDRLDEGRSKPLTLVTAPTGYGKSTLISSWLESSKFKSAWISVDEDNNNFSVFLNYFFTAIRSIFPQSLTNTEKVVNTHDLPDVEKIAEIILNDLAEIDQSFNLILDDFHHITDSTINKFMQSFLRHPALSMHLIIISRRDPNLPLYELRAGNKVNELRIRDLRFSQQETALFFERIYRSTIDPGVLQLIDKNIEGWAAGLRLLVTAVQKLEEVEKNVALLDTNKLFSINGFIKQFLDSQSAESQDFLLKSAVFEKFCASLCDYVCFNHDYSEGVSKSEALIKWLEAANLFTIHLDDDNYWHRYHHVFRNALQMQGRKKYPAEIYADLHLRAADWFNENHMLEEAIEHYIESNNTGKSISLFNKNRITLLDGKQWLRLEKLLNMFPAEVIEINTGLAFCQAWVLIYQGKAIEMFELLPELESLLHGSDQNKDDINNLIGELNVLKAWKSYNVDSDFKTAHNQCHIALEKLEKNSVYPAGIAWVFFAGCHQGIGKSSVGINRTFGMLNDMSNEKLRPYLFMAMQYVYWLDGDLANLEKSAEQLLGSAERQKDFETQANAGYFLGLALYLQNNLKKAREILDNAYAMRYQTVGIHHLGIAFVLIQCYMALGDSDRAFQISDEIRAYAVAKGNPYFIIVRETIEAELNWYTGNEAKAFNWLNRSEEIPLFPITNAFSPHLTRAKLLIYQATPEAQKIAFDLLKKLENYLISMNNQRFLIDVFALQSILDYDLGQEDLAGDNLKKSLKLAEPGGFIRTYLDFGPKMANLLNILSKKETNVRYMGEILSAFKENEIGVKSEKRIANKKKHSHWYSERTGIDLTERESEILSLISQHLQNKEIGEKLFISPETVKKHTSRIYQKLHVDNRRKAVEKAQALGLI